MAILINIEKQRAFLMCTGSVYVIMPQDTQEGHGVQMAEYEHEMVMPGDRHMTTTFLCTVMVEKEMDVPGGYPKFVEMYLSESGGFRSVKEWLDVSREMYDGELAVFKVTELYQWGKEHCGK